MIKISKIELNKIAASILLSTLVVTLSAIIADFFYKPNTKIQQRGYVVETSGSELIEAQDEKDQEVLDIETLMANANIEAGKRISKKCVACHDLSKNGPNKIGPHLWGIVNSEKASRKDFAYSKSMLEIGGIWDRKSLFNFLHKPRKFVPGTKMAFIGIKKPQDIANIIAYLEEEAK